MTFLLKSAVTKEIKLTNEEEKVILRKLIPN